MASDPVTTDPKGEADRDAAAMRRRSDLQYAGPHQDKAAYGVRVPLDPWFVGGLTEGEGCFCISFAVRDKLRTGLEVRPSFSLSLNEKDLELLRDLQAFFGVCRMIEQGDHLRRDGLRQIIDFAYEMNLGKRRLTKEALLRALMR